MSGGGPTTRHARAHEDERLDVGARDPRMEDVSDDRHVEAGDPAELLVDRVEVEERLGRMLVRPVPRVHDVRRRHVGDDLRRADVRVAEDDDVGVVGADRERRVLQRLALVHRGARRLDRHDVRGEPLRGELEARRRARRGLEEHVHDGPALERRELLHLAVERARERACEREEPLHVVLRQICDRDEMPPPGAAGGSSSSRIRGVTSAIGPPFGRG